MNSLGEEEQMLEWLGGRRSEGGRVEAKEEMSEEKGRRKDKELGGVKRRRVERRAEEAYLFVVVGQILCCRAEG